MTNIIILGFILLFDILNYLVLKAALVPTIIVGVCCLIGIIASFVLRNVLRANKLGGLFSAAFLAVLLCVCCAAIGLGAKSERLTKADDMDAIYRLISDSRFDKALQRLDAYDGKYGKDDLSNYNRAVVHLYSGRYEEAKSCLNSVSNSFRSLSADYWFTFGETYEKSNDLNSAVRYYQEALKIDPNHYESLLRMGDYCLKHDPYYKRALYYLQAAERQHPEDAGMLFVLAKAYFQAGDYADAKFYLDQACSLGKGSQIEEDAALYYAKIEEEGGIAK